MPKLAAKGGARAGAEGGAKGGAWVMPGLAKRVQTRFAKPGMTQPPMELQGPAAIMLPGRKAMMALHPPLLGGGLGVRSGG